MRFKKEDNFESNTFIILRIIYVYSEFQRRFIYGFTGNGIGLPILSKKMQILSIAFRLLRVNVLAFASLCLLMGLLKYFDTPHAITIPELFIVHIGAVT